MAIDELDLFNPTPTAKPLAGIGIDKPIPLSAEDLSSQQFNVEHQALAEEAVDVFSKVSLSTGPAVGEWNEILTHPNYADVPNQEVLDVQNRFIDHLKTRDEYKDMKPDEFMTFVEKPIYDRTFMDKRFRFDYFGNLPWSSRVGWGIYNQGMKLPFGLPTSVAESELLSSASFIDPESAKIVREAIEEHTSQLPYFSGESIVGTRIPRLAVMMAEFALVGKAGIGNVKQGAGLAQKMGASAERLAAVEAFNVEGWAKPIDKTKDVLGSYGMGLAFGGVKEFAGGPIQALGITTGALATKSFYDTKKQGGTWSQSFRAAADTIEQLVAMEVVGTLRNVGQARKIRKQQKKILSDDFMIGNPKLSRKTADINADAILAANVFRSLAKSDKSVRQPLEKLEKAGELTPDQSAQLDGIRNRMLNLGNKAQKKIVSAEKHNRLVLDIKEMIAATSPETAEISTIKIKATEFAKPFDVKLAEEQAVTRSKGITAINKQIKNLRLTGDEVSAFLFSAAKKTGMKVDQLDTPQVTQVLSAMNTMNDISRLNVVESHLGISDKEAKPLRKAAGSRGNYREL